MHALPTAISKGVTLRHSAGLAWRPRGRDPTPGDWNSRPSGRPVSSNLSIRNCSWIRPNDLKRPPWAALALRILVPSTFLRIMPSGQDTLRERRARVRLSAQRFVNVVDLQNGVFSGIDGKGIPSDPCASRYFFRIPACHV